MSVEEKIQTMESLLGSLIYENLRRNGNRAENMSYYENNAKSFVESTLYVDMRPLYQRFLPLLPECAHILDAGCGSGRDTKTFLSLGYEVVAMDAAPALAALAESNIGQPVEIIRFQEVSYEGQFDGIWACASLLHVPQDDLLDVFQRLFRALKPGGVLYASFKYGSGEHEQGGRWFTYMNETGLLLLLEQVGRFTEIETWISEDRRVGRGDEYWLNTLLQAGGKRGS